MFDTLTPASNETTPRPLEYRSGVAVPRRAGWRGILDRRPLRTGLKVGACVAVLGLVFAGGTRFGKVARQQAPAIFGPTAAVRAVEADPRQVIYDEFPPAAAALLAGGGYVNPLDGDLPAAILDDGAARSVYALLDGRRLTPREHGAQALLGEMQTADGMARVVSVRYLPHGVGLDGLAGFIVEVFDMNGVLGEGRRVFQSFSADVLAAVHETLAENVLLRRDLRLYGGQIDPADPSHFTIAYEADGVRGVLDGYLLDDGRTIEFGVRADRLRELAAPRDEPLLRSATYTL